MRESLRARLLLWHTITVAAVIAVFAVSLAYVTWRARIAAIDTTLAGRAAELARAVEPTTDGRIDLILAPGLRYDDGPNLYHVIWGPDGSTVDGSNTSLAVPRPPTAGVRMRDGRREFALIASSGVMVLVGSDLADVQRDVWSLASTLVGLGLGILLLSVGVGWWFVGRALEPLDRINRTARQMTGGDLTARIRVDSVDTEVGQFARALNNAFDQLQGAVDRQRRFTADASHELRTPLTTLSTEVQWATSRPRTAEELRAALEVCGRAVTRMQSVIERLLRLARGEAPPAIARVTFDDLVMQAVEQVSVLAKATNVTLTTALEPCTVDADADQLREAITNVLANAVRYNVEHGRVDVTLKRGDGTADLTIVDTGIGIGANELPFIFEPFFRGDPARSRDTGGAGLGLAVTKTIVEQHGGSIRCESEPGRGTRITIRWPLVDLPTAARSS